MLIRSVVVAAAALIAIALGLYQLNDATAGLTITRQSAGQTPVTVFRPDSGPRGPAVVIAHGFAGSQQLMQPFAVTLARYGFTAVTFDFLGHGRHPSPLTGSITQESGATRALVAQTIEVANFARTVAGEDQPWRCLGHSMASDIVVRAAAELPNVKATVAVSMFSPAVTASNPKNLLVIVGALEPEVLKEEARRAVAMISNTPPDCGSGGGAPAKAAERLRASLQSQPLPH